MLEAEPQSDLFFAVVIVPIRDDDPMEFRILTHQEVIEHFQELPKFKKDGQPYKPGMDGLNWGQVKSHSGGWEKLPK